MTVAVWNGTQEELIRLKQVVDRNCACDTNIPYVCSSHHMLTNQQVLDHLLFVSSRIKDYVYSEFAT